MKQILFFISVLFSSVIYSQTISNVTPSSGRVDSCVSQSITWDSSGTSDYYNIYYSVDNGANWISIATSYNTISNTFSWTVPNVSSVNSLIKVTDANQESTFGTSDQVFIIDGSLILLYPSGNENFIAGNEVNIIYDYNATQVSNIKIEYSVDDGSTWVSETNSTVATGSYVWTIPNLPNTSSTKLRLTDTQDSQCKIFESEDNFSITSTVEVITPNGGQTFKAKVGAQGNTVIMNNGPETINTASFYDNGGLNNNYSNQNYTKVISPDFPTNKIKVKFQSYAFENGDKLYIYNGDSDDSPLLGTLSGSSSTTSSYTASNSKGQLTFKFESDQDNNNSGGWDAIISSIGPNPININWNIVGTSKYFNIDYSQDSGSSWTRIVSNYYSPSGSYQWQIPNTPTTNGRIKITDAGNGDILDISDADFTIEAADPFVILYEPNGGESFFPGASTTIEWASAFFNENIRLDYSIDGGSNWLNIIASTNTVSNSFNWTVPGTPSTQVKVRISNPSELTQQDQSDNLFTILDYITLSNPGVTTYDGTLPSEAITRCSDQVIRWTAGATSGTFKVEYTLDGSTWVSIVDEHSGTATGNNSKTWRAPDVSTSNLQYRITDVEDTTKTDTSLTGVIQTPLNPVVLLSPNGSESFISGTSQQINYEYGSSTTGVSFQIRYAEDQGWQGLSVNNNFADGQATFVVANIPTTAARIRIVGNQNNGCDYDISDQVFTIVSSVTITEPNGGESWQATVGTAGHGQDIVHSDAVRITNTARVIKSNDDENFIQVFYPDSPQNRLQIKFDQLDARNNQSIRVYRGVKTGSAANWGTDLLYQAYNTTSTGGTYTSIAGGTYAGALTVVSSNVQYRCCTNQTTTHGNRNKSFTAQISSVGTPTREIKWDIVGTSGRFDLDYSIDNGSTWSPIVYNYGSGGVYNWQVPNAASTSALVRVTDAGNGDILDVSDANFTIEAADPYYAIDNIASTYVPFSQVTLNWDVGGFDQDLVDLHYSVDNGITWIEIISDLSSSFNGVTPLDGSYDWNLPIGPTAQVKVRVSDPDDITIGANTNTFSVSDYITVSNPGTSGISGSVPMTRCSNTTIYWTAGATSGTFKVEYTLDGSTWVSIVDEHSGTATGNNSKSWNVPDVLTSNLQYRITDVEDTTKTDTSLTGVIQPLPDPVVLLSPNGSESFISGTSQQINYEYGSSTTGVSFQIRYAEDQGWQGLSVNNNFVDGQATFVVANIPTTAARIRIVGNQNNGCDYDISDQVFTIVSSVTITEPNGGESWQATVGTAGHGQDIVHSDAVRITNTARVIKSNDDENFIQVFYPDSPQNRLQIKFDQLDARNNQSIRVYRGVKTGSAANWGTDLLYQAYNTTSTGGTYTSIAGGTYAGALTVVSSNVQYRCCTNQTTTHGNRNKSFTAQISSVGTPTREIKWDIVGTSGRFDLDYSIDNGSTWSPIVYNYGSGGVYNWQVPNAASTSALVRVTDAGNGDILDVSDANFTIEAADPYYAIDNIASTYVPFSQVTLNWDVGGFDQDLVDLHYSVDNGITWIEIISDLSSSFNGVTPLDGSYDWNLPIGPTAQVKVRVSDPDDITIGANTNTFSVSDYITVSNPGTSGISGSVPMTRCSNTTIYWTAGATSGTFKVEYTLDGSTWVSIVDEHSGTATGNNSKSWNVPDVLTSNLQYRITDVEDTTKTDTSLTGVIQPLPDPVVLLSPNGSESFISGTSQQINYEYGSSTTGVSFQIRYAEDQGWQGLSVNNNFVDGQATFVVANIPTTAARIRIVGNQNNGCDYDISDQVFTIVSSVTITEPNGGESWQATVGTAGHGQDIVHSDAVRITNTARVIKSNDDENFIQVFYPDSPQNRLQIKFDQLDARNNQSIRVYRGVKTGSAANWGTDLLYQAYNTTSTGGTYTSIAGGTYAGALTVVSSNVQYRCCTNQTTTHGNRNKSFTAQISSVGTPTREIKWDIVGTSGRFDLDYSIDNGSTWSPIVYNYGSGGVYNWQVPNAASTSALVRVTDAGNGDILDVSDANFTIEEAGITLLSQNGGEIYYYDQEHEIIWDSPDSFDQNQNVNIDYSINGGTTWLNIVTDYVNSGSYNWTIPEVAEARPQTLVRVQETGNTSKFDVSNNYIELRPRLRIVSPNDNQSLFQSCTASSITWYGGATTAYKIEISTNNGVDWATITDPNSSTHFNSYDWSIPNTPSELCLIKVSERNNPEYYDISDNVFTIEPSITITSPLESQNVGSVNTVNISWDSNFTSDTYNIDYSIDFGDTWISVVEEQIFTTTSYDWDISDIDETIIYVRVSDYLSPCKDDIISFSLGLISDITISNDNIDENQNINSLVGEFSVNGTGSGNYVYELISGQGATNNSSFSISDGKLYSNEEFDYESATSKSIRVGVTDQVSSEVFEKEFNIKINDLQDTNYPIGDCNGDFSVSVIDIVMLVDYISGENPSGFFIQNADVNQDGNINVLDIIGIVNIIMGVEDRNNSTETELDLSAEFHWDGTQLLMESNSLVSGLQLEFENYFELNTTELENEGFEVTSYLNGNKFVVLVYSMNGQSIQLGQNSLLESLSETPIINVINSLGSDPSLNQISIVFNENSLNTNNINFKENLNLYPNPTDKELHFEFNNLNVQSVEYKVYDAAGREVQKINRVINSSKDYIDLKLSSGTYNILIKIKLPSGEIRQAFEKFIMK